MSFAVASPSIVRSVVQRNMLNSWLRLFDRNRTLPAFPEYRFDRMETEVPDLAAFIVSWRDGAPRFKMSRQGSRMAEAFGYAPDGTDVEDFVGADLAPQIMPRYYECLTRYRPVYSSYLVTDTRGREVTLERLLLPFGEGFRVDTMLGSSKAISDDGAFEMKDLMRRGGSTVLRQAVIDTGFALNGIAKQMDDDVIEI